MAITAKQARSPPQPQMKMPVTQSQKLKEREVERIIAVYKENRIPEHKPKKVEEDGLKG